MRSVEEAASAAAALAQGSDLKFTNLEKVFFPATQQHGPLAKAHLILYYHEVREVLLPYLRDRPLVLRRYPNGITGDFFYQKDWPEAERVPGFADRVGIFSADREGPLHYLLCNGWECLVWLPQLGCIEVHPWLSPLGKDWRACATADGLHRNECGLDRPDQMVLDVDPYVAAGKRGRKGTEAGGEPGLDPEDWAAGVRVALLTRDILRAVDLEGHVKTSGKRGLHIYVPLEPRPTYDEVRRFAKALGARLVRRHYDLVTLKYDLKSRAGKVFFDYNQNVRGKTLASAFSVRPTPEATVSMPLAWEDLERVKPEDFTLLNVPGLVKERGDPWKGLAAPQPLPDQLPPP
jgi:bifunctional non-homologous end joining protein LigD